MTEEEVAAVIFKEFYDHKLNNGFGLADSWKTVKMISNTEDAAWRRAIQSAEELEWVEISFSRADAREFTDKGIRALEPYMGFMDL